MNKIIEFKKAYERFVQALEYIERNIISLKSDKRKWKSIKNNFTNKFEKPLDEAWNRLSKKEKQPFISLYIHRREISDELWKTINKAKKVFKGKIKTKVVHDL